MVADGRATLAAASPFYRTSPVDYLDQDWFVNGVVKIHTRLSPLELLETLKCLETDAGRKKNRLRFGPRTLDMDILFFDDQVIRTDTLIIPHPRMHRRRFVLKPICDIDPVMVHPVLKKDMRSLLDDLGDDAQKVVEI